MLRLAGRLTVQILAPIGALVAATAALFAVGGPLFLIRLAAGSAVVEPLLACHSRLRDWTGATWLAPAIDMEPASVYPLLRVAVAAKMMWVAPAVLLGLLAAARVLSRLRSVAPDASLRPRSFWPRRAALSQIWRAWRGPMRGYAPAVSALVFTGFALGLRPNAGMRLLHTLMLHIAALVACLAWIRAVDLAQPEPSGSTFAALRRLAGPVRHGLFVGLPATVVLLMVAPVPVLGVAGGVLVFWIVSGLAAAPRERRIFTDSAFALATSAPGEPLEPPATADRAESAAAPAKPAHRRLAWLRATAPLLILPAVLTLTGLVIAPNIGRLIGASDWPDPAAARVQLDRIRAEVAPDAPPAPTPPPDQDPAWEPRLLFDVGAIFAAGGAGTSPRTPPAGPGRRQVRDAAAAILDLRAQTDGAAWVAAFDHVLARIRESAAIPTARAQLSASATAEMLGPILADRLDALRSDVGDDDARLAQLQRLDDKLAATQRAVAAAAVDPESAVINTLVQLVDIDPDSPLVGLRLRTIEALAARRGLAPGAWAEREILSPMSWELTPSLTHRLWLGPGEVGDHVNVVAVAAEIRRLPLALRAARIALRIEAFRALVGRMPMSLDEAAWAWRDRPDREPIDDPYNLTPGAVATYIDAPEPHPLQPILRTVIPDLPLTGTGSRAMRGRALSNVVLPWGWISGTTTHDELESFALAGGTPAIDRAVPPGCVVVPGFRRRTPGNTPPVWARRHYRLRLTGPPGGYEIMEDSTARWGVVFDGHRARIPIAGRGLPVDLLVPITD
jgi:hypothetical protein